MRFCAIKQSLWHLLANRMEMERRRPNCFTPRRRECQRSPAIIGSCTPIASVADVWKIVTFLCRHDQLSLSLSSHQSTICHHYMPSTNCHDPKRTNIRLSLSQLYHMHITSHYVSLTFSVFASSATFFPCWRAIPFVKDWHNALTCDFHPCRINFHSSKCNFHSAHVCENYCDYCIDIHLLCAALSSSCVTRHGWR
jgi:hypothetical protein